MLDPVAVKRIIQQPIFTVFNLYKLNDMVIRMYVCIAYCNTHARTIMRSGKYVCVCIHCSLLRHPLHTIGFYCMLEWILFCTIKKAYNLCMAGCQLKPYGTQYCYQPRCGARYSLLQAELSWVKKKYTLITWCWPNPQVRLSSLYSKSLQNEFDGSPTVRCKEISLQILVHENKIFSSQRPPYIIRVTFYKSLS